MLPSCVRCGDPLSVRSRSTARYCSSRCRTAAHRAGAIPAELRALPRWVRRSAAKVPLTVDGDPASSTDPETWSTYRDARRSSVGVGLGFVLNGDGLICLDLDHCLDDGLPRRDHLALLERLPATYTEVSPGGDGLHVWLRGSLPRDGHNRVHGVRVEAYSSRRYITVTGARWGETPTAIAAW